MTHWRTNTSGRLTEGAFHQPSTSRANTTPRDSNIYYLPPSPSALISPPADLNSSDLEFGAFCFALIGLCSPFAVAGAFITIWLLFFS